MEPPLWGARVSHAGGSGPGERSPQAGRAPSRPCCAGLLPRGLGFAHVVLAAQQPAAPHAAKKFLSHENSVLEEAVRWWPGGSLSAKDYRMGKWADVAPWESQGLAALLSCP